MILDTNALSALAQKEENLIRRLGKAERLAITLISIGEFTYGARQSNARDEIERWMREQLLTRVEILFPDLTTAEYYAEIRLELKRSGTPIPANDVWIAALARQHAMPLISLDRHFDAVKNLTRISW